MAAKYIPGTGPVGSPLMVIGECPGGNEEIDGKPFTGATGDLLSRALLEAGVKLADCYRTNVFKYRPPGNDWKRIEETGHSIDEGLPQLWEEIQTNVDNGTNAILGLGDIPLNYVAGKDGIHKYRGSILTTTRGLPKYIASLHPAALLHQDGGKGKLPWSAWQYIKLDIKRAVQESKSSELNLPQRTLEIARSSLDLHRFLERYRDCTRVSVDIEVIRCVPVCIGLAFNNWHGIAVPLINIPNKFTLADSEKLEMHRMLQRLLERPDIIIIGQNFKFDREKIETCLRIKICNGVVHDLGIKSHTLYPEFPKALEFWTSIVTREPYYKSELHEFNFRKDRIEDLFYYQAKDAVVPFEVDEEHNKELKERGLWDYYHNFKRHLHDLYYDIEYHGWPVDFNERARLKQEFEAQQRLFESRLWALAGWEVNVNSQGANGQVAKLLYGPDSLAKFPRRMSVDEETLTAVYSNHAKTDLQKELIQLVLDIRKIRKTISTYVLAEPDYDGMMRTSHSECGTETSRSATHVMKAPVRPFQVGMSMHTCTKHGEIGPQIRRMFTAPEGWVILNADLSQAEARIVAMLSTDDELLAQFEAGIDVHAVQAAHIFGGRYEIYTKAYHNGEECPERFLGKTCKHACNYKQTKRGAMITINTDAKKYNIPIQPISEWKAAEFLKKIHAANPKIAGVFWKEIEAAIDRNKTLVNPFGRERIFFGQPGEALYREAMADIPQSTVRDQVVRAMYRMKKIKPTLKIIGESHDAIHFMVKESELKEDVEIIRESMQEPIDFARCTLPRGILKIPCDIEIGRNYKDLKKWKPAA